MAPSFGESIHLSANIANHLLSERRGERHAHGEQKRLERHALTSSPRPPGRRVAGAVAGRPRLK